MYQITSVRVTSIITRPRRTSHLFTGMQRFKISIQETTNVAKIGLLSLEKITMLIGAAFSDAKQNLTEHLLRDTGQSRPPTPPYCRQSKGGWERGLARVTTRGPDPRLPP